MAANRRTHPKHLNAPRQLIDEAIYRASGQARPAGAGGAATIPTSGKVTNGGPNNPNTTIQFILAEPYT